MFCLPLLSLSCHSERNRWQIIAEVGSHELAEVQNKDHSSCRQVDRTWMARSGSTSVTGSIPSDWHWCWCWAEAPDTKLKLCSLAGALCILCTMCSIWHIFCTLAVTTATRQRLRTMAMPAILVKCLAKILISTNWVRLDPSASSLIVI